MKNKTSLSAIALLKATWRRVERQLRLKKYPIAGKKDKKPKAAHG